MSEFTNTFHNFLTKMGIKYCEWHMVPKYRWALQKYIQTKMDFLDILSLGIAYRYVVKIELKFNKQKKQEFGFVNLQQSKYGKGGSNSHGKGWRKYF
jgi:hypothetical protein